MVVQSQFIEQFSDERWPLKSISELCDIVTDGEHQTPRRVDSGIYLLSARNVKNQELSFDDVDYIDEQEYQRIAKRIEPQENDVLISCSGSVGRTCVVPKGIRFQLVRSVALLRFKPLVDPLFMSYQMAMPYVQSQIETLKSQTSQANLFQGNIKKIQVIVPSKEEQKRFIIVVRKADKSKFDGLKSQFIEMFDRCSESFKKYPISDLCHSSNDIKCGPFGTQLKQAEYTDQGIPVWGIPQINSGFTLAPDVFVSEEKARQLEQFSLVSEDIAMSRKGNVGQCALYPDSFEDGIIASDVVRIRVNKEMILPHFLVYQLHNSHQIRKQILEVSDGTVMAGINVTKMKGIIVYCPSISSQQKFKTILGQADKSKFELKQAIEKIDKVMRALMQ